MTACLSHTSYDLAVISIVIPAIGTVIKYQNNALYMVLKKIPLMLVLLNI